MTLQKTHSFRHLHFTAAIVLAALITAACGGDDTPTVLDTPSETAATTTVVESSTPVDGGEHPCDTGEGQPEDPYCLVDGQWFFYAGAGHWVESDGPPATTTASPESAATPVADESDGPEDVQQPEPEGVASDVVEGCSESEHRHSTDGGCHTDHEFLPEAPSDCEDDPGDGECSVGEATYQLTDQNDWLHEDIPAQPEVIVPVEAEAVDEVEEVDEVDGKEEPETATGETYDSSCADMAELEDVWITTSDERQWFDLTQTGWYEWTSCLVSEDDNPDLFVLAQGLTTYAYAGADYSLSFPGMGSVCREGVEEISPRRFRLRFPVRNDPYDAAIEPEPCYNPVFDGSRGAWASDYEVRNFVTGSDLPYVAYFRLVRVDGAEGDAS